MGLLAPSALDFSSHVSICYEKGRWLESIFLFFQELVWNLWNVQPDSKHRDRKNDRPTGTDELEIGFDYFLMLANLQKICIQALMYRFYKASTD